jgi:hypothetical protein
MVAFGEWSFGEWSPSEIGRSEIGRSENGRSENGRSENGRCTQISGGTGSGVLNKGRPNMIFPTSVADPVLLYTSPPWIKDPG